jgi:tetratricopeptide (TPR) repeat protein
LICFAGSVKTIRRKILPVRAVLVRAILGALCAAAFSVCFADPSAAQLRRTLEIQERTFGADSVQVANALHELAEVLKAQGGHAEAERLYWRSVMIRSYLQGAAHPSLWPTFKGLAEINQALGRPGEAEKLYSRASAIAEKTLPAFTRARLYEFAVGDSEAAASARGSSVSLLQMPGSSISERESLQASERPAMANQLEALSEIYRAQGRLIEAIDVMRRVLAIRERAFGPNHPEVARSYGVISSLLAAQRGAPAPGARSATD